MDAWAKGLLQIVQARMWAQGLTIGVLIVAGALTQTRRKLFAQEVCLIFVEVYAD